VNTQFWTVWKADALWCATAVAFFLVAKVAWYYGGKAWRCWRIKRKIENDLKYCAPEMMDARRQELEERYGLRPMPIMGYASSDPTAYCPYCGKRLTVMVAPDLTGEATPIIHGTDAAAQPEPVVQSVFGNFKCKCPRCDREVRCQGDFCETCGLDPNCHNS
jgi:hypothetical protein